MNETSGNPIFVVLLLFAFRCLIPLAILFGISYLLRRLGLVTESQPEPPEAPDEETGGDETESRYDEKEA
jgi:hypothetical protein